MFAVGALVDLFPWQAFARSPGSLAVQMVAFILSGLGGIVYPKMLPVGRWCFFTSAKGRTAPKMQPACRLRLQISVNVCKSAASSLRDTLPRLGDVVTTNTRLLVLRPREPLPPTPQTQNFLLKKLDSQPPSGYCTTTTAQQDTLRARHSAHSEAHPSNHVF